MLSVTGIYDGKNIYPVDAIKDKRKYKVIITFVEELDTVEAEQLSLRNFGTSNTALGFWSNPQEDIYRDYLPKSDKANCSDIPQL